MTASPKSSRHRGRSRSVSRTLARLAAAQALYEIEVASASPHEVVPAFVSAGFRGIFERLLDELWPEVERLSELLGLSEPMWSLQDLRDRHLTARDREKAPRA